MKKIITEDAYAVYCEELQKIIFPGSKEHCQNFKRMREEGGIKGLKVMKMKVTYELSDDNVGGNNG